MLDKLKDYTQYFKFYEADTFPINKEFFLLGDKNLNIIEKQWLAYSNNLSAASWEHPNSLMDYIGGIVISSDSTSLYLTLRVDRTTLFHKVDECLPKTLFRIGFLPFTSEKRLFMVVAQEWFEHVL